MIEDFYPSFTPPTTNFFGGQHRSGGRGPRSQISPQARAMLGNQFMQERLGLMEQSLRLESLQEGRKMREIQYESARFNLQEAKDKSKRERETLESLSGLQQQYDSVLGDPNLSGREKRTQISRLGLLHADKLALSPVAQTLHNTAASGVSFEPQEAQSRMTLENFAVSGGNVDYLKKELGVDSLEGVDPKAPLSADAFSKAMRKTQLDLAQGRAAADAQEQQRQIAKEDRTRVLRMEFKPEQAGISPASLSGGDETNLDLVIQSANLPPAEKEKYLQLDLASKLRKAKELLAGGIADPDSTQQLSPRSLFSQ